MKNEQFYIVDSLSLEQDSYFCEDGTTTKNKSKAMVVSSMSEGYEKVAGMTLYRPVFELVLNNALGVA